MKPYQLSKEEVLKRLSTDETVGLSSTQVNKRLKEFGQNLLKEQERDSWAKVFIRQFNNPLIYILLIAASLIFFAGQDKLDAFIITGVLLFNAVLGSVQEGKAQDIMESLKRFIKTESVVIRDGKTFFVDEKELVPGDIILLLEGERIPADARVIESVNLKIDESIITGESLPVKKSSEAQIGEHVASEQINMVFKGTYIFAGSGKAVVTQTGQQTQIGQISLCIKEIEQDMPLKKELDRLSKVILIFIFFICLVIFLIGFFTGKPIKELFVTLTALFICVVPEGLPIVLTLILVMGARKLAQKKVLVKKMQAVEGLGKIDTILIDKTGTLTRNELVVSKIFIDDKEYDLSGSGYFFEGQIFLNGQEIDGKSDQKLILMAKSGCLLNRAEINYIPELNNFEIKGDPTEAAMFVMSEKIGIDKDCLRNGCKIIYEIPFSSKWRYHAAFCKTGDKAIVYISGAPELILDRSNNIKNSDRQNLEKLLKQGFRVVAIATKEFDEKSAYQNGLHNFYNKNPEALAYEPNEKFFEELVKIDLNFIGFCGINDSIRPEVAGLVKKVKKAGIDVVMVTGDHKETAIFVSRRAGIFCDGDIVLQGRELETLSDDKLLEILEKITVFARVTPEQKLRIVRAYKSKNKIIAMTGDGINDAPALVFADIGIAMGAIGTEVAKQAADIVLLDDSFSSIASGVEYGRHIFYTLRRVILYFFSTNMGEIFVVLFSVILGLPLPITAAQILWLNLITDGFLDTALAAEKIEKEIIKINGFKKGARIIDKKLLYKVIYMALPMGIVSTIIFYSYRYDIDLARSMTMLTMAMFQWFNAFNCRSEKSSVFALGLFSNKWLMLAITGVLGLQFLVIYNPVMQKIFDTKPISINQWLLVFAVSSSVFLIEEARKFIVKKFW